MVGTLRFAHPTIHVSVSAEGTLRAGERTVGNRPPWPAVRHPAGGPDRTRTCDLRFRKPLLYPAELRDRWRISISRSGVLKVLALRNRPRTQMDPSESNRWSQPPRTQPWCESQRAVLRCSSCASRICGQIRIKRFLNYDKNAPAGPATESRSCFYCRLNRADGSASEAERRGRSV